MQYNVEVRIYFWRGEYIRGGDFATPMWGDFATPDLKAKRGPASSIIGMVGAPLHYSITTTCQQYLPPSLVWHQNMPSRVAK